MRIKAGDQAPQLVLPSIDGTTFEMSAMKGKRVIFTFFRFSTCPFCNMRIDSIVKRWDEVSDDSVMSGVFDADGRRPYAQESLRALQERPRKLAK